MHLSRRHARRRPWRTAADRRVKALHRAVQAGGRTDRQHVRRVVARARRQPAFARRQRLAHLQRPDAIVVALDRQAVIARPGELRRMHAAAMPARVRPRHEQARRPGMAGQPAPVLAHPAVRRHRFPLRHELRIVPPGEAADAGAVARQRQGPRREPFHVERLVAVVRDARRQREAIAVYRDPLDQGQTGRPIDQRDDDRILAFLDRLRLEPLREPAAAAMRAQRGRSEPAGAERRRHRQRLVHVQRERGRRPHVGDRRQHRGVDLRSPPAPHRRPVAARLDHDARRRPVADDHHALAPTGSPCALRSRTLNTAAAAANISTPHRVSTLRGSPPSSRS